MKIRFEPFLAMRYLRTTGEIPSCLTVLYFMAFPCSIVRGHKQCVDRLKYLTSSEVLTRIDAVNLS